MIHYVLTSQKYSSWVHLERQISGITDVTEKGDAFEQVAFFYFSYFRELYQIAELYSDKVPGHQIPPSFKTKLRLAKKDSGVDGLFIASDGTVTAYQAKFRSARIPPSGNELNDFWSEAEYADYRLVISNAAKLPADAEKRKNQLSVLVNRFDALPDDFFDLLYQWAQDSNLKPRFSTATPRDYQVEILDSIVEGFSKVSRGKVVAACGIGKTLVALWATERLHCGAILFLAPSLALIRQTLTQWSRHASIPFSYLCVCSDSSINKNIDFDEFELLQGEIDVPITTQVHDVLRFLGLGGHRKKVIFSTYQSLEVVTASVTSLPDFKFDLMIFDEAHRTAGTKQQCDLFSLGLHNENIPASRRLFLTATERLVKPWIKDRLKENNQVVFSMDDEELYGPLFHRLPFGSAIERNIICDYRILVPVIQDEELYNLVKKNRYLAPEASALEAGNADMPAQLLFKAIVVLKVAAENRLSKVISFHSSIKDAQTYSNLIAAFSSDLLKRMFSLDKERMFISHVNGKMATSDRTDAFHHFEESQFGLLSNVRCLTEGVDIPDTDAVFFADPKDSIIDIVQAVGRALRKPRSGKDKIACIIIPIIFAQGADLKEAFEHEDFQGLHNVIQAMRDQDETLSEWVDSLNLSVVKGHGSRKKFSSKVQILNLSQKIDVDKFEDALAVRIAEINGNPKDAKGLGYQLGKTERKSEYRRVFQCLGDYNFDKYRDSAVLPTLTKFSNPTQHILRSSLIIDHNNVSHTERLGLIEKQSANLFKLTPLGQSFWSQRLTFEKVFLNQMMLFCIRESDGVLYPYRAGLKLLINVSMLTYIEFLFSVCSLQPTREGLGDVASASEIVEYIRTTYPRIELTSHANKTTVQDDLNARHHTSYSAKDVWTDRTTTGNLYRYFLNHMSLLRPIVTVDFEKKVVSLDASNRSRADEMLERSSMAIESEGYVYGKTVWV